LVNLLLSRLALIVVRLLTILFVCSLLSPATATPWINQQGVFSHNPATGERVTQYAPTPPVYGPQRADYARSGYRQTRSTLRGRTGTDNYHIVEEWGRPVRPYGEWLRPYRPYSVPYQLWGPPFYGQFQSFGPYFDNRFPRRDAPFGGAGRGGPGGGGLPGVVAPGAAGPGQGGARPRPY